MRFRRLTRNTVRVPEAASGLSDSQFNFPELRKSGIDPGPVLQSFFEVLPTLEVELGG